jgi:lectin-like protein
MTWADAEAFALQQGGTLAALNDAGEQQWLLNTVSFGSSYQVWLGGRDHHSAQWTWETGEPFSFAPWFLLYSYPEESFAMLIVTGSERGGWVNHPGGALHYGVVESCYANCDASGTAPALNVADFTCFLQKFAAGDGYANCDGGTTAPLLSVADFTCFLQRFAAGCP